MLNRMVFLLIFFGIAVFIVIGVRLFYIQVMNHEFYEQKAVGQQTLDKVIMPQRGTNIRQELETSRDQRNR
jgi:cell division protein FtsI/penicillin-binding protein 2